MRQFTRAGIYAVPHTAPINKSATVKLSATGALVPIVANQYRDSAKFSSSGALAVTGQVATKVTLSGSGQLADSSSIAVRPSTVKLTGSGILAPGTITVTGGGGGGGTVVVKFNANQIQDSIGVVIHPSYSGYNTGSLGLAKIITSMTDMGITHYRTGSFPGAPSTAIQNFYNNARNAGLMANILIDNSWGTSPNLAAVYAQFVNYWTLAGIASAEGTNEPDNFWTTAQGKAQQANVYPYFKAQSSWAPRPFIGVSMAHETDYSAYGKDSNLDAITLHAYERHFHSMPEDGRLQEWITAGQNVFGTALPLWNTEHGYVNGVGNQDGGTNAWVPEDVAGDYFVRGFVYDKVVKNIVRSFIYELYDDVGAKSVREQTFGLVRADGTPKDSYIRIKNFLGRLNDTAGNTAPTKVSYSVGSTGPDVQVIPVSRNDGTFDLMIWRATSIWDYGTTAGNVPGYITVTPVAVPITLPTAKRIVQYTPHNDTTATLFSSASSFTVQADGRMKMVRVG